MYALGVVQDPDAQDVGVPGPGVDVGRLERATWIFVDRAKVHIGGTSNGGLGAFDVMLDHPDRFATLLGAPGLWMYWNPTAVQAALEDKSVFNGVGELDSSWYSYVEQTHERLVALGIDSVFVVFEGQDHIPDSSFDPAPLFGFWQEHS